MKIKLKSIENNSEKILNICVTWQQQCSVLTDIVPAPVWAPDWLCCGRGVVRIMRVGPRMWVVLSSSSPGPPPSSFILLFFLVVEPQTVGGRTRRAPGHRHNRRSCLCSAGKWRQNVQNATRRCISVSFLQVASKWTKALNAGRRVETLSTRVNIYSK